MTDPSRCIVCEVALPSNATVCPACGAPVMFAGAGDAAPDADQLERLRVGLGSRYDVERELGRGGMATVYLARDRKHHRRVAVKVLHPDLAVTLGSHRFLREIEITAQLQHPHILPVHDSGHSEDLLFYVMPFVEGESLRDRLQREGRLPVENALRIVREVGSALSYAHAREVIHRDIKPENILLSAGHAQVADFGIARAISRAGETQVTRTGMIIGTPAYMAPEQAAGTGDIDGRADLYALAAVACELLTGEHTDTLRDADVAERALLAHRPEVGASVAHALTSALALDRDRRPDTVEAWLARLDAAQRPRRSVPVGALLATAGLVVIGGLSWLWWRESPAPALASPTIAILPFSVAESDGLVAIGRDLPLAFEAQLQWLPEYRIVSARRVRDAIEEGFGAEGGDLDSLTAFVATQFAATEILWGRAEMRPDGDLRLEVQVRDGATRRVLRGAEAAGSLDSLSSLISEIVVHAFAVRVAEQQAGWSAALPRGLEAFQAYYRGDMEFRRGAYDAAVIAYDEVIRRDSTFATAYVKRVLAEILRSRPTTASDEIASALHAARQYRDGLDPTSLALLDGYELLVARGDLEAALAMFRRITESAPDAVEPWFILGFLQSYFGSLIGLPPEASRIAFERALELDPQFAAPIAQLARLAILRGNEALAKRYIAAYLHVDSVSVTAELLRMSDSALYGGTRAALSVTGSLPRRSSAVLETIALGSSDPQQGGAGQAVTERAMRELWNRATTDGERATAFRMLMAATLGGGAHEAAESLWREARQREVPDRELDRWLLLTEVTGIAQLGSPTGVAQAAARLLDADDPTDLWLAARRYAADDPAAARARTRLERLAAGGDPLAASLWDDLAAVGLLARGDTVAALARWRDATRRYRVEQVPFGLVASLWPLRLERARVAALAGDVDQVLAATNGFEAAGGIVDQLAWPEAWQLRAEAHRAASDPLSARATYQRLVELLRDASGAGAGRRAQAELALEEWR